jgi:hypothetical protein
MSSTKATSLFGFLPEAAGMAYLKQNCVLTRTSTTAIREQWLAARATIRVPIPRAGQPEILDFPPGYDDYLGRVCANAAFEETVRGMDWSFKLVELDPLIAFQIQVELARSANLCSNVSEAVPLLDDMLGTCLPLEVEDIEAPITVSGNSLTVQTESMNLKFRLSGLSGAPEMAEITIPNPRRVRTVGIHFFPSSPLLQVVRFRVPPCLRLRESRSHTRALRLSRGANYVSRDRSRGSCDVSV